MIGEKTDVCELCSGTGWVPIEGSLTVRPCTCQAAIRKQQRMASTCIPRRYADCTFEAFRDRSNTTLATAVRRAREFADLWPIEDRGLLLMGPCGTGKTHLAVSVLRAIIDGSKPGRLLFVNFQDLIQQIQASFETSSETPTKSEILNPVLEADLLVLDELGSQKPTNFVQDILYYVINTRYNEKRQTLFTTNYLDEPRDGEESLEQRIGKRLRSRLYEMARPVVLAGVDDFRKTRAKWI